MAQDQGASSLFAAGSVRSAPTVGKWEVRPAMARPAFVLGVGETGFAIFEQFDGEPSVDEVLANAILSSAAPDLRRALTDLLELVCVHGLEPCRDFPEHEFDAIVDGAVQDSRKALAKARGQ